MITKGKAMRSYFSAFKFFKESLLGYAFGVSGMIAGAIIAFRLDIFSGSLWSIAVYPAILSARGIIGGLFSGRLSTALHLGTVLPRFFKNTGTFRVLLGAIFTITFEVGVIMSLFTTIFCNILWGGSFSDFPMILGFVLATLTLGLLIILITLGVSFMSFKHGLDPDIFLYPAVAAISDILMTLFYILVLSFVSYSTTFSQWFIASLSLCLVVLVSHSLLKNFRKEDFIRTLRESFLTLIIVAFVVNITGAVLRRITMSITRESEIYLVFPALMTIVGDMGAIVGSTATTKLAVGLLSETFSGVRNHWREIFCAWTASVTMFIVFSFLSLNIRKAFTLEKFLRFTSLLLITNTIAAAVIILVSYTVAILTFKRGLDPDNFVIPLESVLADSATLVALFISLSLLS